MAVQDTIGKSQSEVKGNLKCGWLSCIESSCNLKAASIEDNRAFKSRIERFMDVSVQFGDGGKRVKGYTKDLSTYSKFQTSSISLVACLSITNQENGIGRDS